MDVAEIRDRVLHDFHAEEYDHFGKVAFRLKAKKPDGKPGRTFMTLWLEEGYAVLMLSADQQQEWLDHASGAFERHPSKWGDKGATIMRLKTVNAAIAQQAIATAFSNA